MGKRVAARRIPAKKDNSKTIKKQLQGLAAHPELINRDGRPRKGNTITECYQELLETDFEKLAAALDIKIDPKIHKGKKTKMIFALAAFKSALGKNYIPAIKEITDRVEGTPKQKIEMTGGGVFRHKFDPSKLGADEFKQLIRLLRAATAGN